MQKRPGAKNKAKPEVVATPTNCKAKKEGRGAATLKPRSVASGLRQQAPTRSMGGLLLALALEARALSLSAPDGLAMLGARQTPIASVLLTRKSWLEALRMRLAITLGVGGFQGTTVRVAVGRLGAGSCLEWFWDGRMNRGM